ncbi:MAG: tetratricopeptide (TPR) repeat protein [Kiritimatiellia bacterium]|jgi:tetratricopeptide (TPR) repeat protein
MFEEDWLLQIIERMAEAIAAIGRKRDEGQVEQALKIADDAITDLIGVSSSTAVLVGVAGLGPMLMDYGNPSPDKPITLALLLSEEATLLSNGAAEARRLLAVRLLCQAMTSEGLTTPLVDKFDEIVRILGLASLDDATQLSAARVYEDAGRYDRAEDLYFNAVEGDPERHFEVAMAFYERCWTRDPNELRAGGLPLDEIAYGIGELQTLVGRA